LENSDFTILPDIKLFIAGAIGGYSQGRYWWKKIYGDKRIANRA